MSAETRGVAAPYRCPLYRGACVDFGACTYAPAPGRCEHPGVVRQVRAEERRERRRNGAVSVRELVGSKPDFSARGGER